MDASLVERLLREQHPDLADLPIVPSASGWDNAIYRLGGGLAVRLPRRAISAELTDNEQRWLPEIAERLPVAVPLPVRSGAPSGRFPWPWTVVRWCIGDTSDRAPLAEGEATRVAEVLSRLHVGAPAEAPRNPVRGVPLVERSAVFETRVASLAAREVALPTSIRTTWGRGRDAAHAVDLTWIHGDLHPLNVLSDGGRLTALIDWGDVCRGDPATDLACLWSLFGTRDCRQVAWASYHDAQDLDLLARARGWAALLGVILLDSGLEDSPRHADIGRAILAALDEDFERP